MSKLNSSYLKQKFKSGGVSTLGYKRNSPDVNNPYNIIPSNQITMNDVDFPVLGIDDLGNQIMMQPGQDYTFPGSYVTEFPMKNMGNKRFAQAGMQMPIYTSDWSKVKNYNDSLNLYNKTRDIENPNYYEQGFPSWYTHRGTREEIERFMRRNNMDVDYTGRFPGNIQPVATGDFGEGIKYPIYKKPFQPYIYDPYKEFLGKLGDVKPMGLSNMDVTTEMDMTPRTVSTPNRVYKYKYPTYKVQSNYQEPGIYEYGGPGERYYREIVTPMRPQRSIHAAKHTKNYKKEGGVIRQSRSQVNQTLKYSKQKPNKI
jgi:hypothetical protein